MSTEYLHFALGHKFQSCFRAALMKCEFSNARFSLLRQCLVFLPVLHVCGYFGVAVSRR
jgi:hypothetical protein